MKLNDENDEMSVLDPNKTFDDKIKIAIKNAANPRNKGKNKKNTEKEKIDVRKHENININTKKTESRNMKTLIRKKTKDQEVSLTPKENIRKWLTHKTPSENSVKCFEIGPRQSKLKEKPKFKNKKIANLRLSQPNTIKSYFNVALGARNIDRGKGVIEIRVKGESDDLTQMFLSTHQDDLTQTKDI